MIGDAAAMELHAGVGPFAEELELELQLEVAIFLGGHQKFVAWNFFLEGAADDRAVLDAKVLCVSFPTGEGFAVE